MLAPSGGLVPTRLNLDFSSLSRASEPLILPPSASGGMALEELAAWKARRAEMMWPASERTVLEVDGKNEGGAMTMLWS